MNVRNLLRPGDYYIPIPIGLPVRLVYNTNGVLKQVFRIDSTAASNSMIGGCEDISEIKDILMNYDLVPKRISITGGTTAVSGVLVGPEAFSVFGPLPECVYPTVLEALDADPHTVKFWAFYVESHATQFVGALAIQRWLEMFKFNTLRGQVLSVFGDAEDSYFLDACTKLLKGVATITVPAAIAWYRSNTFSLHRTEFMQEIVSKEAHHADDTGTWWSTVGCMSKNVYTLDYAVSLTYGLKKNVMMIIEPATDFIAYRHLQSSVTSLPRICPTCGAQLQTSPVGRTTCTNNDCGSYQYARVCRLLDWLKLPVISSSKWRSGIRKKKNVNVLTVLDFPEYKDVSIRADLYSVIRSVCCNLSATSDSALTAFLNRCANSYPTVLYYLEHPQVARDRKDIYIEGLDAVLDWFESPAHLAELHSLSGRPNLEIQNAGKQFDGAPIFRGTTIAITGAFLHGTMDDIEHILSSYDATVVRTYCPEVRMVLIGDQLCDIDGGLVQAARAAGCKIFSESEFFQMHEIDQDLRNNLL